jgi:hypothetical protein
VRVPTYARGEVITVGLSQSVHSCIAVLLSRLPVVVTVPIVKAGLFCHGKCAFLILGPHGPLEWPCPPPAADNRTDHPRRGASVGKKARGTDFLENNSD